MKLRLFQERYLKKKYGGCRQLHKGREPQSM